MRGRDGEVLYFEGTVEDVSRAYRAQRALEASERRFRALAEKAQVLSVLCDERNIVFYASPAARAMLGCEPEALRGSNVFDWIHPEDLASARSEIVEVLASKNSGVASTYRYRHTTRTRHALAAATRDAAAWLHSHRVGTGTRNQRELARALGASRQRLNRVLMA